MGLLDDLESEAQRRKSNDEDAVALKAARETAYRSVLDPAMANLFTYLKEFVAKLKELQPKIAIRHTLPGYGDVVAYVEHEYDVREVRQPSSKEITMSFFAAVASSECPSVQVEGAARARAISALFQRHRLGAPLAASKDASGEIAGATFKAKGRIPLTAVFGADAASGQLKMTFTNFDDFSTAVKTVGSDQVNEALYDQVGRYLMREPTDLMREVLSDNYRSQLRASVLHEEVKRRWESQIVARQQEDITMLKREYGLGARFNRIGDAMGKLRGLVSRKP